MHRQRAKGIASTAIAATLWGGWPLVLRPAGLPAGQSTFTVLAVLGLALPFALRAAPWRDRGAVGALLFLGVAEAGNMVLYFAAMERGPLAVAVLTHYLAPLLVTLAAPWVARERTSPRVLLAAGLSLVGLGLVVWRPGLDAPLVTAGLGGASAVIYAVMLFAMRRASRAFRPVEVMSWHNLFAAGVLLLWGGRQVLPPVAASTLLVVAGAIGFSMVGSLLFYRGLVLVTAPVAAALTYLEPLTAALLGWVVFGEPLGWLGALGAALVLGCGIWVVTAPHAAPARPAEGTRPGARA